MVYDFDVTPDWHQLCLYNGQSTRDQLRVSVPLCGSRADGAIGLDANAEYYVYDFWNDAFAGRLKGSDTLRQELRGGEARVLSIRKVLTEPQVVSTNRHLMQGYLDLEDVRWNPAKRQFRGKARVVAGDPFQIVLATNGLRVKLVTSSRKGAVLGTSPHKDGAGLVVLTIKTPASEAVKSTELKPTDWCVSFEIGSEP